MTTKRILFKVPGEDGVRMLSPAPEARLVSGFTLNGQETVLGEPAPLYRLAAVVRASATIAYAETEAEFVARIRAKDVPANATGVTVIDENALPPDRHFRGAWEWIGGAVEESLEKAKPIAAALLSTTTSDPIIANKTSISALRDAL